MSLASKTQQKSGFATMSTFRKTPPFPPARKEPFVGAIKHPSLLLWDSWVMKTRDGITHLYCLALSRRDHDGREITPGMCNQYRFHYRHFTSNDEGQSWYDQGPVLHTGNMIDGSDAGNVWSGSVLELPDGRILFGYTGIGDDSPEHAFVQSICFGIGTVDGPTIFPQTALSHPLRDRAKIVDKGYYLPSPEQIGNNDGEDGGPITGWRDPYLYQDNDGTIYAFWSAKLGPARPAVAWGKVTVDGDAVSLELLPPIHLPDEKDYSQSEVPKICFHAASGEYVMMISACNRMSETQPDEDIFKQLRLYRSASLAGPWRAFPEGDHIVKNMDHLFGASFLESEVSGDKVRVIAPYTVKGGRELELTFAPVTELSLV